MAIQERALAPAAKRWDEAPGDRSRFGWSEMGKDIVGWPAMPPPKAKPDGQPNLVREHGFREVPVGTLDAQRFTGNPTGNVPKLVQFQRVGLFRSPLKEDLVEHSPQAMQQRMTVYHSFGGPRGMHVEGDYVAPDGKRHTNLAEHVAYMAEHFSPAPYASARSGATFTDPNGLLAEQVARRHTQRVGTIGKAHSVRALAPSPP